MEAISIKKPKTVTLFTRFKEFILGMIEDSDVRTLVKLAKVCPVSLEKAELQLEILKTSRQIPLLKYSETKAVLNKIKEDYRRNTNSM